MATSEQIVALCQSYVSRDPSRFRSITLQIAARYDAKKQHATGSRLQRLAQHMADAPAFVQLATPLTGLLSPVVPRKIADMALDAPVRAGLDRLIAEQRQRELLRERGFAPMRRLLCAGPPGVGKTMTAAALGGELELPVYAVRLDGVIESHLGETAKAVRKVFDEMASRRAVYLLDEFDALGARRDSKQSDVAEMRRATNSLLQFLEIEMPQTDSVIVATTNMRDLLDPAVFRRFDLALEYGLPTLATADALMRARLAGMDAEIDWSILLPDSPGDECAVSHAGLTAACERAAKAALMDGREAVRHEELLAELRRAGREAQA